MNGQYNLKNTGRYCAKCGTLISADMNSCPGCGAMMNSKMAQSDGQKPLQQPQQNRRGRKRAGKTIAVILAIVIVIAAAAFFYFSFALGTPPDLKAEPSGPERLQATVFSRLIRPIESAGGGIGGVRDTSKYTFLVLGADHGEYNTDVIMAVMFDTSGHTLEVVNIPRDTLVNVSWPTKKANSILANMRAKHSGEDDSDIKAMDSTVEMFAEILGFEVDYWIRVNMKAFVSLIDDAGGVDFYVPVDMNYDDVPGGLSIHYTEGLHHLSGQQALEVLRFRSGYSGGDLSRIGTQQDFLRSAAEQMLYDKSSLDLLKLANILLDNVETNLKQSDLIWLGREFMKLDADSINFCTIPGKSGTIRSGSYVTIQVDEWLEVLNDKLNPFFSDFTAEDLSILTRGENGKLYVTDGNRRGEASWGN